MNEQLYESAELLTLDLNTGPALIPGVLTATDKVMCMADPKVGKSILGQQLASAVAGNHAFIGHQASAGAHRVLYVAGEGDLEELQERGQHMGMRLPVPADRLYYWPLPTYPLNTPRGFQHLLEMAELARPQLTIIDPIYALMSGSMKDDDRAGDFVRNMNAYQYRTGSAVVLIHHAHRPIRTKDGELVDEGDSAYYGSVVWAAWPKSLWLLVQDGPDKHHVTLSCMTYRRSSKLGRTPLMMAEPQPLLFVQRSALSPTAAVVLEALRWQPAIAEELVALTERSRSSVSEALTALRRAAVIAGDGGRPEQFAVVA